MTKAANRPQRVEAEQFEDALTVAIARAGYARELTKEEVESVAGGVALVSGGYSSPFTPATAGYFPAG